MESRCPRLQMVCVSFTLFCSVTGYSHALESIRFTKALCALIVFRRYLTELCPAEYFIVDNLTFSCLCFLARNFLTFK